MNLDKLSVNVRPLPPYQALDLGLAMARAWHKELSKCWWIVFPYYLFLFLLMGYRLIFGDSDTVFVTMWLSILILAIFRVQTEIAMMTLLSQKVFDNTANIASVKTFLQDKKTFGTTLRYALSPSRVVAFAVSYLEGQQGSAKSKRLRSLMKGSGNAIWLSALSFFVVELVLFWGGVALFLFLLDISPMSEYGGDSVSGFLFGNANERLVVACVLLGYMAVMYVTTPFFVASAFAVYLCRRSLGEGWDIELSFRQMSSRYQTLQNRGANNEK